jgi:hypothetical protein
MKELKELPHQHDQLRASYGPDYGKQSEFARLTNGSKPSLT